MGKIYKKKSYVSNTIYKPRQNIKISYIYREIAISLGKTKKRKGLFHIYKKPPIEKQLYIYNESWQSTKEYIQEILGQDI